MNRVLSAAVVLVLFSVASSARAQGHGSHKNCAACSASNVGSSASGFGAGATYSSSYIAPYSYYASFPYPARTYVGYGSDNFPFYGNPYGYPYDRWTWWNLSAAPYAGLARYYYPPVR